MSGMPEGTAPRELNPGEQVGRYRIVRSLGKGGMGVVYVARDERLDRDVALKMIAGLPDDLARSRFWREARAAASVNHPNICQVFEVDESGGNIFLTMELLEGEGLDRRLMRAALPPKDAVPVALGILRALEALHGRGLVHRDVKPSNVFVTPHGPKLLDFGLARPVLQVNATPDAATPMTQAGMIVGTPQYMAPEQITGETLDGRTDVYATGAVLFQMLAGRAPFTGSGQDMLFAALKENPPALQGPPEVVAIDRVIRRAMRKNAAERYATAAEMAADLSAIALSGTDVGPATPVRALTRIVMPPLRITRTDPDISFLSFGLAEAVSASLATLGNIVVRAPAVAAKWNDDATDPRKLAAEADVDLVVASTLRRSGPQLRVTAQLIDASSGTLIGATTINGAMDDIFALEDALTNATTALLSPQLTIGQPHAMPAPKRDVPANPRAFELFLRGMEEARTLTATANARKLFQQAVAEDANFAPAWAALGRCHRVWGKYYGDREESDRLAEEALRRALALSPDLPIAHRYFTHFESEHGRAVDAIVRLLKHAATNRHDAHLFAGLVHACRYAGLLDASMAAHEEAIRLDPTLSTGVEYTIAHLPGGPQKAAFLTAPNPGNLDGIFPAMAIGSPAKAYEILATVDTTRVPPAYQKSFGAIVAFASGDVAQTTAAVEAAITVHVDPEAVFMLGLMLSRIGVHDRGLEIVTDAVKSGYTPLTTLRDNEAFNAVRGLPAFKQLVEEAEARLLTAQKLFEDAGGPDMLGMPAATRLRD